MKLTIKKIETAKPADKPYKLFDGGGLYLHVTPNGSKLWRLKYRFAGKEKTLSIGPYPQTSLASARKAAYEAKEQLQADNDPGAIKAALKAGVAGDTFGDLAAEWQKHKRPSWSDGYARQIDRSLKRYILPALASTPIATIKPLALLGILKRAELSAPTMAEKLRQWCGEIFTYAVITGRAEYNPAGSLNAAMTRHASDNFNHLQQHKLPAFFAALERQRHDSEQTYWPLRLISYVGLRPSELTDATWSEIDFDRAVWEIPKERMKKKRAHIVPLSRQALEILRHLKKQAGREQFIFPNKRKSSSPMSKGAMLGLIYRMEYGGRVTPHGFRHTMSTILHEHGYNTAWIEMQLAHLDQNAIRGIYNHALYIDGRREMMQWYADHLDRLRDSIQD
ncbi:tyrosine-type recombinase/integrase [Klebsiella pneumoniae]